MAFVTNNHKLGGLTNTNLLPSSSVGQKSYTGFTGCKSRCWQDFLFGGPRENSVLCPFQLLEAAHTPWFMFFFIHLQIQQCSIFKYPSLLTSISITSLSRMDVLVSLIRFGPIWMIQDSLPISGLLVVSILNTLNFSLNDQLLCAQVSPNWFSPLSFCKEWEDD